MLSPGETRPGDDSREAVDHLFRALARLVPDSGVQFLDLLIPRTAVEATSRAFSEDKVRLGDETIWALVASTSGAAAGDAAQAVFTVTGRQAVAAVIDQWIPLPMLRFVSRDGSGRAHFDEGPYNWVRLYIASPAPGDDPAHYRAVIAFDTRIETASRLDLEAYVMPTADDVRFSSSFAMTDDAEQLAPFLSEAWIQDWLKATFPAHSEGTGTDGSGPDRAPQTAGLQSIAAYLTLLTVMRRAAVVPSLQFFDTRADGVAPIPVDLVLDLGTARSCALLVESANGRPQLSDATLLGLRDLGSPTVSHRGAFESRIAFSRPVFGSEALSRKSGRADAFHWPSLARTGPEAVRLAATVALADGAVGVAAPKSHLKDMTPREEMWRFVPDPRVKTRRAQMIAGRLLTVTTPIAGLLTGPAGAVKAVAHRPRYALSAMTSFQIAEVLLQALSAINAPVIAGASGRAEAVRRIRQVIVTAPLTMPREERDVLRERADAAIDMLWKALDWDGGGTAPVKPVVRLGLDETLAAQLVYLVDAIAHRCGGEPRAFLDVMGKSRPEFGVQPCLRFGAIDCGGGHTTMTIVTYASSAEAPIQPKLLGAQRSAIAGGAIVDDIARHLLLPALADAVTAAGGEGAAAFLEAMLTPSGDARAPDPQSVPERLLGLWLRPAATALLQLVTGLSADADTQTLVLRLGSLAGGGGALAQPVQDDFNRAIEAIRSAPVDLAAIPLTLKVADVHATVRAALLPMVGSLSRALVASDCDVVLLTGWAARHPALRDLLLEHMPWRPDRIIALNDYAWQGWYPMGAEDRAAADGKDVSLVGALLALAGGERLGFGGGESGFPFTGNGVGGEDGAWTEAAASAARPEAAQ